MRENETLERRSRINSEIRDSIDKTLEECSGFLRHNFNHLQVHNYKYDFNEATEELGLDADLIDQLLEDYVAQILKSKVQFVQHLQKLKTAQEKSEELDYTLFRELAHKNLGVARNLRVKDGIEILQELLKRDNLDYLGVCIEALESCAIRLKPKCAYEALKLMNIKKFL